MQEEQEPEAPQYRFAELKLLPVGGASIKAVGEAPVKIESTPA